MNESDEMYESISLDFEEYLLDAKRQIKNMNIGIRDKIKINKLIDSYIKILRIAEENNVTKERKNSLMIQYKFQQNYMVIFLFDIDNIYKSITDRQFIEINELKELLKHDIDKDSIFDIDNKHKYDTDIIKEDDRVVIANFRLFSDVTYILFDGKYKLYSYLKQGKTSIPCLVINDELLENNLIDYLSYVKYMICLNIKEISKYLTGKTSKINQKEIKRQQDF